MTSLPIALLLTSLLCSAAQTLPATPPASRAVGSHVTFNEDGIVTVDGLPFFPVGLFTYELNSTVMAELHELQCNTILNGFKAEQLDLIHQHGLMAVCFSDERWIKTAAHHPALLAWYLTDEPEGHSNTPASERKRYLDLKARDPDHPIGLCHYLFDALAKFKDACDFTMTDVYPVTAHRDVPLVNVGIHMDEARRVHGPTWPNWTYIQVFGGADTDGGKWAVPLPHEVRFMAYEALVHRATGILYFSYWPKEPRTWQSIAVLNHEIQRIVPRLVSPGKEMDSRADAAEIQIRGRWSSVYPYPDPRASEPSETAGMTRREAFDSRHPSGVIIAVNTSTHFVQCMMTVPGNLAGDLAVRGESRTVAAIGERGRFTFRDRFGPYEAHVYTWGPDPLVKLARESAASK